VAEPAPAQRLTSSLAVVGLACRFPDADDAPELLDVVLTGRRAFRRIPPVRLDLNDYFQPDRATLDATYSTRAALIEGWQFDCAAFGVDPAAFAAADPAQWLALETTARALAGAGLAGGSGLNRDRTAVIIGNTLGGDTSRANGLRVRWPYVRRVLADALAAQELPAGQSRAVLRRAERQYLAPFPAISADTLAGGTAGTIAAAICGFFGFRGGSHAIDSAYSSSTQAVASACTALAAGEIDSAVAGGVDISLDPLELIGLAKAGVLATDDVRIYDEEPTGFLPAEGCGVVVLMRTADARAADLPVYAEIIGWGTSAASHAAPDERRVSSQLLAMQRAYDQAGVDPADVQLFEGNGAGTRDDDDAELAALGVLRTGARVPAVLGSVKANIGHAKAAAGVAGLIKTVLAVSNGVLPPASGVRRPHPMITEGDAQLALPQITQEWPDGTRHAAVSTLNSAGANVHLVLRGGPGNRPRQDRGWRARLMPARTLGPHEPVVPRLMAAASEPTPFLLHAPDRFALVAVLNRLAGLARWLSDAELQDLACSLGRDPGPHGGSRVGLVAAGQEQLGALAAEAAALLPGLADGLVTVRPGIFAAEDADGRVTLLLSDTAAAPAAGEPLAAGVTGCLEALRWLESLDVHAAGAVGHGFGALAGLAWAGVLGQEEVIEIAGLRAKFLHRAPAAAESEPARPESEQTPPQPELAQPEPAQPATAGRRVDAVALRAAIGQKYRFGPPRRRLISTFTGAEIASVDDAIDLICTGFAGAAHVPDAVSAGAVGATLLVETGPGSVLADAASTATTVPAVSLAAGLGDPAGSARVAAALFAAGALGQPQALFAGRPGRLVDIWRERTFIIGPCETRPQPQAATARPGSAEVPAAAEAPTAEAPAAETAPAVPADAKPAGKAPAGKIPAELAPVEAAVDSPAAASEPAETTRAAAAPAGDGAQPTEPPQPQHRRPVSLSELRTEFERQLPPLVADRLAGVGPWARCYAEVVRPVEHGAQPGNGLAWRLHASGNQSRLAEVRGIFAADPAAPRTLAIVGDPADEDARAVAVQAAREAIETGRLVVVTTSADFTGFFAGLQAEHPALGVTVLRVPDEDGVRLAPQYAWAEPGHFRELILAPDGNAGEPAMSELALPGGAAFPLVPQDVVLVSRCARGAGLALARVLACCGTAVAVIGRPDDDDSELVAGLEELRSAGARIGYEVIDLASPASLAAAVHRIETRLGPVTAIGHAVSPADPAALLELTDIELSDHAANEAAALDRLVESVRPGQLRMIITFGSVAGRYGLAGGTVTALSSGALATRAAQLAAGRNCRNMHIDIPAWSGAGLGDRRKLADQLAAAGTTPIDVTAASRLLLKIMTTQELPDRVALHGRATGPAARITSVPATAEITDAQLSAAGLDAGGRFLANVQVHYPGIELICGPSLAIDTDPYLADYRVDGLAMLPPALALEALAQVASVLAGQPLRSAAQARLESPVVIPASGQAELRICALREGATITAVLRCADSSFAVDHARAEFSCTQAAELPPAVIASGTAQALLAQLPAGPPGLVDGAELYGPISFQDGRFRRIALLPEITARSCRALARGADDQPWFDPGTTPAGAFLLGSPGLADASLQVLQASMPHRRVRIAGCASARFSGRTADGAVEIWATAVRATGAVPLQGAAPAAETVTAAEPGDQPDSAARWRTRSRKARRARGQPVPVVPAQAAPPGPEYAARPAPALRAPGDQIAAQRWDIEAVDAAGQLLIAWRGVELHDAGPLPRRTSWPPPLLAVYLERAACDAGLDMSLRVRLTCGQPGGPASRLLARPAVAPDQRAAPSARAGQPNAAHAVAGGSSLAGFELSVRASVPVACAWSIAEPGHRQDQPLAALAPLYARLRDQLDEPPPLLTTRLRVISACLAEAGLAVPDAGGWVAAPAGEGWVVLQSDQVRVACAVTELSGVTGPVVVAILTAGQAALASARQRPASPVLG
jgi:enediyne polyketide synthase